MALGLSVVVGVIVGVVLFNQLGPFPSGDGSKSPGPGTSASATPSGSSSPDPSSPPPSSPPPSSPPAGEEPSPTDSADADPAFTQDALLSIDHMIENGWESAGPVDNWDALPPEQITQCAQLGSDDQVVDAYAATIDGLAGGDKPISSAEVVMRFPDTETAEEAMADLVRQVNACDSAPPGESTLTPGSPEHPGTDDKVDDTVVWSAEGEDGKALAVIGLARADDRIALLSLSSFGKDGAEPLDPKESADIDALTIYAGRRLV